MPADQGRRLNNGQRPPPVEPAAEPDQGHLGGVGGSSWFDVALLIQGQLLTQKEVLRGEGGTGAQAQEQETHRIHEEYQQRACEPDEEAEQAWESSHSQGTPPNYRSLSLPIVAAEGRNVQSDEDGIFAEHRAFET